MKADKLGKLQNSKYSERMSICIDCANCIGNCSWSQSFTPVEGWTAISSKFYDNGHKVRTYRVISCPLFKYDNSNAYGYRTSVDTLASLCGVSVRSIARWSLYKINKYLQKQYPQLEAVYYRDPVDKYGNFYLKQIPVKS